MAAGDLERDIRRTLKVQGKADSTADADVMWAKRFIVFSRSGTKWRHPRECGKAEVEAFLTHLATEANVSPNTQNQAFSALCFLYRHVLKAPLEHVNALRAKTRLNIPVVLSLDEVDRVLSHLRSDVWLPLVLQYGCGLRVSEAVAIRWKDVDWDRRQIAIWHSKHNHSRMVPLPMELREQLSRQRELCEKQWRRDQLDGANYVPLPDSFGRKSPAASHEFRWSWVFPAKSVIVFRQVRQRGRWHLDTSTLQKAIKSAADAAGILKRVTTHTLRHSYATHLLKRGESIATIQELLGHKSIETTRMYLHVAENDVLGTGSPLADLLARRRSKQDSSRIRLAQ